MVTKTLTESLPSAKHEIFAEDCSLGYKVSTDMDLADDEERVTGKLEKNSQNPKQSANIRRGEEDTGKNNAMGHDSDALINKSKRMRSLIASSKWKKEMFGNVRNSDRKCRIRKVDVGKLERIMNLSVEMFYEIAALLTPNDLSNLSRTNRSLRAFLMSRSSRAIWIACFNNIGFPPCPSDMSEPQYASLFFEKDCHACGNPRVDRTTYHLRIRLCKGCAQLNIVQGKRTLKEKFGVGACKNYEIYTLLPWSTFDQYRPGPIQSVSSGAQSRCYLKYDFLEVIDAYMKTKPKSEERKEFVRKRQELVEEIDKNICNVRTWREKQTSERFVAENLACDKRKEQIVNKLVSIEYSRCEILSMWSAPWLPSDDWERLVEQPRELTERIWKSIQPKLENLIIQKRKLVEEQTVNANRQKRHDEMLSLYKEYVERHELDKADGVPLCFVDLCEVPFVKDLVEENKCEIEMTAERWCAIEEGLPIIQRDHSLRVERDCLELLLTARREASRLQWPGIPGVTLTTDANNNLIDLRGAGAFFQEDDSLLTYEEVLSSRRAMMLRPAGRLCRAWGENEVSIDVDIIRVADALLSSLNFPRTTTMKHAMESGKVFICKQCNPSLQERMTWRELFAHLHAEVGRYSRMQEFSEKQISPSAEPEALEKHNLSPDASPLAAIDPDFVVLPVEFFL